MMTIYASSNPLDNMLLQILGQQAQPEKNGTAPPVPPAKKQTQDIVTLSGKQPNNLAGQNQTGLVSEKTVDIENGYRRTQDFENAAGKKFTRIEEVTTTPNRSKRLVIQHNESGSTTALENIIDRQEDGSFRLIQHYTDETGVTKTNVNPEFNPLDTDILLGRPPAQTPNNSPFQNFRGTEIDLSV